MQYMAQVCHDCSKQSFFSRLHHLSLRDGKFHEILSSEYIYYSFYDIHVYIERQIDIQMDIHVYIMREYICYRVFTIGLYMYI